MSQQGKHDNGYSSGNQDATCILPHFMLNDSSMFFGVFDGHGEAGSACSSFTKGKLPTLFEECLRKHSSIMPQTAAGGSMRLTTKYRTNDPLDFKTSLARIGSKGVEKAFFSAYTTTNTIVLNQKEFDSNQSGTTAI